ncbi:MAG: hypothetical protein R6U32_07500 [Candidatus Woesearchaeota archaeon]
MGSKLTPQEREQYKARDSEIREEIATYIVTNIDTLVTLAEDEGISSPDLAAKWQDLYQRITKKNGQKGYSEQLNEALNAQGAGLVDKFAELFEDNYRYEPDLSIIKEKGKLPKDDDYYPCGVDLQAA